jgi:hypothetical protein
MDGKKYSRPGRGRLAGQSCPVGKPTERPKNEGFGFASVKLGGSCRETRFAVWATTRGTAKKYGRARLPLSRSTTSC